MRFFSKRSLIYSVCLSSLVSFGITVALEVPAYQAQDSDVSGRNFEGANLSLANFMHSKAAGASFKNANLDYTNLSLADFSHADLTNTSLKLALIEFTNFTAAKGLSVAQLKEACITQLEPAVAQQLQFDFGAYTPPKECVLWEHVPRG